jgi:5-formyltetrahydrofolate cyclo-ligase
VKRVSPCLTTSNARREYDRLGSGTRLLLEEKRALRNAMMARRQEVSLEARVRLSAAMTARLESLPELAAVHASGGTVAGFVALPAKGEVDPAAALAASHASGAKVALPRVSPVPPRLRFHEVDPNDGAALAPGPYGLREPVASTPEVDVEDIDVMLLPGLAFDRAGRRLGYGGGYYDEVAGKLRAAGRGFLVGLAYDFQLVERCPAGEADVGVDCVVTDLQVVRCAPAQSSDGGRA